MPKEANPATTHLACVIDGRTGGGTALEAVDSTDGRSLGIVGDAVGILSSQFREVQNKASDGKCVYVDDLEVPNHSIVAQQPHNASNPTGTLTKRRRCIITI